MAVEERWQRRFPHHALDLDGIQQLVGAEVLAAELLTGGLRNTNYKVQLAGRGQPLVPRLYTADAAACGREVALLQLVHERVPVPAVVRPHAAGVYAWTGGGQHIQCMKAEPGR